MRTQIKSVALAPQIPMEYARIPGKRMGDGHSESGGERETISRLLPALVKKEVTGQLKEQRDYYRSRPSLAAKQMEQLFGQGSFERVLLPAVTRQVCEQLGERARLEWLRKGR